jgi:hypothetical protein
MKTNITILLATAAIVCMAQINSFSPTKNVAPPTPYDKKIPPALSLNIAYNKAVQALGTSTNKYYCISTTCLNHLGMVGSSEGFSEYGWTFIFSNTNGTITNVYVFFDKASTVWVGDLKTKNGF